MAFARVVSFNEVTRERIEELKRRIGEGDLPDGVPASEIMLLNDPQAETALAILFFETEDDYRQGDEALSAMSSDDTPGQRGAVARYDVVGRRTM